MKRRILIVQHVRTGGTALACRAGRGLILVQFDDLAHPHSEGWHLYPRHHFKRRVR